MRTPQITSVNLKTLLECQKTPQNRQKPIRTVLKKLERFWKSEKIPGHQRMPQNLQKVFKQLRTHENLSQNTPKHLLNVRERLKTIRNLYEPLKTCKAENASETFWNVSKPLRTGNNASNHVRTPRNVRQPLRTFTNISEPPKTHQSHQDA